jgi:hypothetical protein
VSENFKLPACLCALVLIESTASWRLPPAPPIYLFPPVARKLDGEMRTWPSGTTYRVSPSACLLRVFA